MKGGKWGKVYKLQVLGESMITLRTGAIAGLGLVSSLSLYVLGIGVIEEYPLSHSKKVETQEQLEQMVNEEKVKLGCELEIKPALWAYTIAGSFPSSTNSTYGLVVGGDYAVKAVVKHEVYHICDGHFDRPFGTDTLLDKVYYYFWLEPQAALYGAFGLRL